MRTANRVTATAAAVLLILTAAANAQVRIGPRGPEPTADNRTPPRDVPQRAAIVVGPQADEPQPPLRYALYPRRQERTPGNSVPYWYRALLTVINADARGGFKTYYDNYDRWTDGPISELPLDELRPFVEQYVGNQFGGIYSDARIAALRSECDWDWHLEQLTGAESIEFRLEDAQQCRSLARLLILEARLEIAEHRYDDALETLQICYRLGEDLGRNEIFIAQLVGMAVTSMTDVTVLALIRAPDSPNLYWALASRPRPLFDVRRAAEFEVTLAERIFPEIAGARTAPRSSAEWQRVFRESVQKFAPLVNSQEEWPASDAPQWQFDLFVTGLALQAYPRAKRDLIESGATPEQVAALPVGQALAEHAAVDLEYVRENSLKWFYLPQNDGRDLARATEQRLMDEGRLVNSPWTGRAIMPIAGLLMPAVNQVIEASERRERFLNMLLALEAVRMQIAHDGKVPASLADVTIVPVPDDRYTESPFVYSSAGHQAVLELRLHATGGRQLDWEIELHPAGK